MPGMLEELQRGVALIESAKLEDVEKLHEKIKSLEAKVKDLEDRLGPFLRLLKGRT